MENQLRTIPSEPIKPCHAVEMRQLSMFCPLCNHVHAIPRPPAAPVLFALSSSAVGLTGLFVLISTIFAKELTSEDGCPYVFSCDTERTRPSGGAGELGHKCMPLIHTFSPIFMVLDPLVLKVKGALPGQLFNTNDSKITWPGPELSRFSTLNYILEQTLLFSNVKDI